MALAGASSSRRSGVTSRAANFANCSGSSRSSFGVPGLPGLNTTLGDDGTADLGGVFLVRFSNETSVPSAFLIVSLAADRGTNAREATSHD